MKIRLTGSQDTVRAWSQAFEQAFGTRGLEVANLNNPDIRFYLDLDDHIAGNAVQRVGSEAALAAKLENVPRGKGGGEA